MDATSSTRDTPHDAPADLLGPDAVEIRLTYREALTLSLIADAGLTRWLAEFERKGEWNGYLDGLRAVVGLHESIIMTYERDPVPLGSQDEPAQHTTITPGGRCPDCGAPLSRRSTNVRHDEPQNRISGWPIEDLWHPPLNAADGQRGPRP